MTTNDEAVARAAQIIERIHAQVSSVMLGIDEPLRDALCCVVAGGHLLIEDVPGTGKTSLAMSLARVVQASVHRITFTPDLIPADIIGMSVFDQARAQFEFRPGPIFANIVVADEINRATPRTQSALLEAMGEGHVSTDGITRPLPDPFTVIATQSPADFLGTYRLPEAQLDLFHMRITLGYPDHDTSVKIIEAGMRFDSITAHLLPVVSVDEIAALKNISRSIAVAPAIVSYVVRVAAASRLHPDVRLGVSMRGCIALLRLAQARAMSQGRTFVNPDDVKALATSVWSHRIFLTSDATINGRSVEVLVPQIVASIAPPSVGK